MYVNEVRKDTDLYERLREVWDGVDYPGLPSFDRVLPDIVEWARALKSSAMQCGHNEAMFDNWMYYDNALDESNNETAVKWLSEYDYVGRAFCGQGYVVEITDGYGELSEQAVVEYAIRMILDDGRYYPVLDEDDYERRETAWLRNYFDGEVSDDMLDGADRDAVFEAWRDATDATSGDMYVDMPKLPEYIKMAKAVA